MVEQIFPPEVPYIGDLLRITPIQGEPLLKREYKFFCEEVHVMSRLLLVDYVDRKYFLIYVNGEKIREIQFNPEHRTWSTTFVGGRIQIEVEKLLE